MVRLSVCETVKVNEDSFGNFDVREQQLGKLWYEANPEVHTLTFRN